MSAMAAQGSDMDNPDLLLLDRFIDGTEAQFETAFAVHRAYASGFSLDAVAPRIRAIATSGARGASRAVTDRLPALQLIAIRGVGTDGVDLDDARQRGIRVTTTPNLLTDDVADLALALLLATARCVCTGDRLVRAGGWRPGAALPMGRKVTGMRIGIVGLGRVGRAIADRLKGFTAEIAYTDLKPFEDVGYRFAPTVLDLASACDALILAAAGGPQSYRIVDEAVLHALGPQGLLINVARGSLVDEAALVSALTNGKLGGAGLDVFVDEPNVPQELWGLETVVLQPHRASATTGTRLAMENLVLENLLAYRSDEPLPSAVC
jgi:lactate dehydrogenase-like 2-hydroxyacid dehydrogenase